jgi:ABC-type transport system involved in cytochrome c biogenesis permease component
MLTFALPTYALLKRELLVQLRMKRTFFWLLVLAVATSWVLLANWPSNTFTNWSNISSYSIVITGIVTGAAFVGSALFVPGIAAVSVVVEKEQGNWDSLYLTLISPKGIALGKFLGAVTLYMIFLFALMPMLAVVFFLIGVDWSQFINLFLFILATTGTLGAIGVACSVTSRKTVWAIISSYIGMAVLMGVPLIPVVIVAEVMDIRWLERLVEDHAIAMTGFGAFIYLMGGTGMAAIDFYWHFAYQGLLATIAVLWTLHVLRKPAKPPIVLQEKPIDDTAILKKRQRGFPFYLIDPLRRVKPIADSVNPMYAREMRCGLLLRRTNSVRLTYIFMIGLFFVSTLSSFAMSTPRDFSEWWMVCLLGHGVLICGFIPAFFANLFTKENELANLDMLLMTSLTPEEIAKGKMYSAIRRAGTFLISSIAANSILFFQAYKWGVNFRIVLVGQLTLCLCVALVLVATMWASILSKRTGPAIIASFIFSYLSLFGPLSLIMIYTFTSDGRHVDDTWLNVSPVFSYGQFVYQWEWHRVISSAWSLSMSIHSFAVYALYKGVIRHYAARVSTKRS